MNALSIEDWEVKLGEQLRSMRLRSNLQQSLIADQAGISVTALKNLESGKGAAIKTLIKVLRVYGREEWLDTLAPPVSISPLQMLHSKLPRTRARAPKPSVRDLLTKLPGVARHLCTDVVALPADQDTTSKKKKE